MKMERILAYTCIVLISVQLFIKTSLQEWNVDEIILMTYTHPDPDIAKTQLKPKVGPQTVEISHIQYMASIYVHRTHLCSGAYFSPLWIVTCASCISTYSAADYVVYMGSSSWQITDMQLRLVEKLLIYLQYSEYPERYNIGLIKLKSAFDVGPTVGMIKLAEKKQDKGHCTLVGWGLSVSSVQHKPSGMLEYTLIRSVNSSLCKIQYASYEIPVIIDESIICIQSKYDYDFCMVDIGTTLVCDGVLVGVTAASLKCSTNLPALAFNISFFRNWILNEVKKYTLKDDDIDSGNKKMAHQALFFLFVFLNKAFILYK